MSKKLKNGLILSAVITAIIAVAAGVAVYLLDFYPTDIDAVEESGLNYGSVVEYGDSMLAFEPNGSTDHGLIFYPGAKVEWTAYESLLNQLSERGILCILVKMPFNLACFDRKAAEGLDMLYPEIEHWYIGGHSLGGVMAADYAYQSGIYDGIVMLSAFPSKDMSQTDMRALSVYGTADEILDLKSYEKAKPRFPSDLTEQVIEGGNHAGFGFYGEQRGDGTATISTANQILQTADFIAEFIKGSETQTTADGGSEESFES